MTAEQQSIFFEAKNLLLDPAAFERFDTKELAESRLQEICNQFLLREKNRFHVVKVTTNEVGEIWSDADIDNDPEEGNYKVLDQNTGLYDPFSNLTEVKADILLKKQKFIESVGLDKVIEINLEQPKSDGLQLA